MAFGLILLRRLSAYEKFSLPSFRDNLTHYGQRFRMSLRGLAEQVSS